MMKRKIILALKRRERMRIKLEELEKRVKILEKNQKKIEKGLAKCLKKMNLKGS